MAKLMNWYLFEKKLKENFFLFTPLAIDKF